jgi:hypothetical protein
MSLRIRWVLLGMIGGLAIAVVAFLALRSFGTLTPPPIQTLNPPAVVHEIQRLNELTSVKYTIQKVVGIEEQKVPLGSEKLLLFVQADVLAGVDLSTLGPADVRITRDRQVQFTLPPPKIVHIIIDDKQTKVWDRRITWWTPWVPYNPDLERQARLTARDEIEKAALEMGILNQARRNAETAIQGLLTALGAKSVAISGS